MLKLKLCGIDKELDSPTHRGHYMVVVLIQQVLMHHWGLSSVWCALRELPVPTLPLLSHARRESTAAMGITCATHVPVAPTALEEQPHPLYVLKALTLIMDQSYVRHVLQVRRLGLHF